MSPDLTFSLCICVLTLFAILSHLSRAKKEKKRLAQKVQENKTLTEEYGKLKEENQRLQDRIAQMESRMECIAAGCVPGNRCK